MSSEAISTLRLSRWVRRRASFAVVVVLPEPCRPTIMIATGGTALRSMVWPSEPSVATSSSWTILTTIWPGVTDLTTVAPTACSRTRSVKLLTTSSETSASSNARRTSRIAASTSASRQRTAPRQPIENPTKLFRQIVEQCRCPMFQTLLRPRAHRAVGRWPPVSRAGRRVEKNVFSRSAGVKRPMAAESQGKLPGCRPHYLDQVLEILLFSRKVPQIAPLVPCSPCRRHIAPDAFRPAAFVIPARANHPPPRSRTARRRRRGGRRAVDLDVPHENL